MDTLIQSRKALEMFADSDYYVDGSKIEGDVALKYAPVALASNRPTARGRAASDL